MNTLDLLLILFNSLSVIFGFYFYYYIKRKKDATKKRIAEIEERIKQLKHE